MLQMFCSPFQFQNTLGDFGHPLFWEGRHQTPMILMQMLMSSAERTWLCSSRAGVTQAISGSAQEAVYFMLRRAALMLCTSPSVILGTFHLSFLFISLCLSWSSTMKADTGTASVSTGWRQTKRAGDTYWDSLSPASKWSNSSKGFYCNPWRAEITQKVSAVL